MSWTEIEEEMVLISHHHNIGYFVRQTVCPYCQHWHAMCYVCQDRLIVARTIATGTVSSVFRSRLRNMHKHNENIHKLHHAV
jgi:hypothetical protein